MSFDTRTYLDRKEKTDFGTIFYFFLPNQNCPWRNNSNLKKIKIPTRPLWTKKLLGRNLETQNDLDK